MSDIYGITTNRDVYSSRDALYEKTNTRNKKNVPITPYFRIHYSWIFLLGKGWQPFQCEGHRKFLEVEFRPEFKREPNWNRYTKNIGKQGNP